jgi:hypothetical protein
LAVSYIITFLVISTGAYSTSDYRHDNSITEILELPRGAVVPPSVYEKYSVNHIAEMLIHRTRLLRERVNAPSVSYDYFHDTEIQLAFTEKHIGSIKEGCFQNQHQTGNSEGTLNVRRRIKTENQMIEVDLNDQDTNTRTKVNWIRPVYAYLSHTKKVSKKFRTQKLYKRYGNIFAVLKDEVKKRSTWTPADSLSIDANKSNTYSFYYKSEQKVKAMSWNYFEAQIWGKTCFEDVKYFIVNCNFTKKVKLQSLNLLKSSGIPVYGCAEIKEKRKVYKIIKGERL